MKAQALLVAAFTSLVCGCSSLNQVVSEYTPFAPSRKALGTEASSPWMGNYEESQREKALAIATATTEEMKHVFQNHYKQYFPGANLVAEPKLVKGGETLGATETVEVNFGWDSPRAFFPSGEYNILNARVGQRDALAFTDLVVSAVNKMSEKLKEVGVGFEIQAIYFGQADGAPVRKSSLKYRGEFGVVDLPQSSAKVNGQPTAVKIYPGQYLTNDDLAFLRAYALRNFAHMAKDGVEISDFYDVKVVDSVGSNHRYAQIQLKLGRKGPKSGAPNS
jgi:hypothetical protein